MTKFVTKKLTDIFDIVLSNGDNKLDQLPKGDIPLVSSGTENQGIVGKYETWTTVFPKYSLTLDMFGNTYMHAYKYQTVSHGRVNILLYKKNDYFKPEIGLYLATIINKQTQTGVYGFSNMLSSTKAKKLNIQVPVTSDDKLDTEYMVSYVRKIEASYVRKIEAYLAVLGYKSLADCQLNEHDLDVLHNKSKKFVFFKLSSLFPHIKQGKRLRKQDQISGNIPFIMSGETNQGFVKFIKNNLNLIPKNSLTIDILGNVFYRNYEYSISDDVGAYWSDKYTTNQMLYLTTSIKLAMLGKFSYGKKFRSSRSNNINVALPVTTSGKPDYAFMEDYITAIEKLKVIKIKQYLDQKLLAYQELTK